MIKDINKDSWSKIDDYNVRKEVSKTIFGLMAHDHKYYDMKLCPIWKCNNSNKYIVIFNDGLLTIVDIKKDGEIIINGKDEILNEIFIRQLELDWDSFDFFGSKK